MFSHQSVSARPRSSNDSAGVLESILEASITWSFPFRCWSMGCWRNPDVLGGSGGAGGPWVAHFHQPNLEVAQYFTNWYS